MALAIPERTIFLIEGEILKEELDYQVKLKGSGGFNALKLIRANIRGLKGELALKTQKRG